MVIEKFTFFRNASTTGDSENTFINVNKGSSLTLEVTGTASAKSITIKGIVDDANSTTWTTLATINANNFNVANAITANGIYMIGIDGVTKIKATIDSISGGNASVVAKISD